MARWFVPKFARQLAVSMLFGTREKRGDMIKEQKNSQRVSSPRLYLYELRECIIFWFLHQLMTSSDWLMLFYGLVYFLISTDFGCLLHAFTFFCVPFDGAC